MASRDDLWSNSLLTLLILVVAFLVLLFTHMQFNMRWVAADIQRGLLQLGAELSNNELIPPSRLAFAKKGEWKDWPTFILKRILQLRSSRKLRSAIEDLMCGRLRNLDNRWKTELASYGLIIIATIVAINLVWRFVGIGFLIVRGIDSLMVLAVIVAVVWFRTKTQTEQSTAETSQGTSPPVRWMRYVPLGFFFVMVFVTAGILIAIASLNPLTPIYTSKHQLSYIFQVLAGILALSGSVAALWRNMRTLGLSLFIWAIEFYLIGMFFQLFALIAPQ